MNDLELATLAFALILVASMFSVELAISSAIIEIVLGVLAGNFAHLATTMNHENRARGTLPTTCPESTWQRV